MSHGLGDPVLSLREVVRQSARLSVWSTQLLTHTHTLLNWARVTDVLHPVRSSYEYATNGSHDLPES